MTAQMDACNSEVVQGSSSPCLPLLIRPSILCPMTAVPAICDRRRDLQAFSSLAMPWSCMRYMQGIASVLRLHEHINMPNRLTFTCLLTIISVSLQLASS